MQTAPLSPLDKVTIANSGAEISAPPERTSLQWLAPFLVALSLASAGITFLVLTGYLRFEPADKLILGLLILNVFLILLLFGVIGQEAYHLYKSRKAGQAGAELHVKMVTILGVVSAIPVMTIGLVAILTVERGLNPWFSGDLRKLVKSAEIISTQFQQQLCQNTGREMKLMAVDLERSRTAGLYDMNRALFRDFMTSRAIFLGFAYAVIIQADGHIVEQADTKANLEALTANAEDFAQAASEEPPCIYSQNAFGALIQLKNFDNAYLLVARPIDRRALEFPLVAQAGIQQYEALEARRDATQLGITIFFTLISSVVLLSAVLLGLGFANRLVQPIRRLIQATDQVATGNLYVQVPVGKQNSDFGHLGATFNNMTNVLRTQQKSLFDASQLIDSRRRFMEAVLSGVPAGVIGLNAMGQITLLNATAEALLNVKELDVKNLSLEHLLPELSDLLQQSANNSSRIAQKQIVFHQEKRSRTLSVRMTREIKEENDDSEFEHNIGGYVITLDDITDLVNAQRSAAWSDVARRIAHEIKNPLTPIQLSAERIQRKFGAFITQDKPIFIQCTETIIRQVEDIKRMVDEFSQFSRMPKPIYHREILNDLIGEIFFFMKTAHSNVLITLDMPKEKIDATLDRRLFGQALQNVIKNAAEAFEDIDTSKEKGQIRIHLHDITDDQFILDVMDNGKGFPVENRERLLEPYMTTRIGGTGLGLPIVAKIIDDHGGKLELLDSPAFVVGQKTGALVRIHMPRRIAAIESSNQSDTDIRLAQRDGA